MQRGSKTASVFDRGDDYIASDGTAVLHACQNLSGMVSQPHAIRSDTAGGSGLLAPGFYSKPQSAMGTRCAVPQPSSLIGRMV